MSKIGRFIAVSAALAALGFGGSAIASADPTTTGGANGHVDSDGTQGEMKPAMQGAQDDDGFQGAYSRGSTYVWPQYR
mgnify:CR=1 FL=1